MLRYIINGLFLTQQMTGLQRYAFELCRELDRLVGRGEIAILIPKVCPVPKVMFENIEAITYGTHRGIVWEQTDLKNYAKRYGLRCVNFCNVTPLFLEPGVTAVHDLMFKLFPADFTTMRNRLSRRWHTFQADYALKHEKWIVVTSHFTRCVLEEHYPCTKGKVAVIPCGWQHVKRYEENRDWKRKYPFLESNSYFFSMATRSKNKNGAWILEAARNNPQQTFVIAGRSYEPESGELYPNVHVLGYISDSDACSLMKNCKAFICPSFYEGFGVPPLEALALGADIIVSNTSALPEVFGDSAHYVDPYNADIDLEALLCEHVAPADKTLEKYSWETSAKRLYQLLCLE